MPEHALGFGVQVRLDAMRLQRPRQWGACWLFTELWSQLQLDEFWRTRLPDIEAHIMVNFLAYCVHITLREKLCRQAPGLTPRQALDHLGKLQMINMHLPTTDGRELLLRRRTEPNTEQQLLLSQLQLTLPDQPPPRISEM